MLAATSRASTTHSRLLSSPSSKLRILQQSRTRAHRRAAPPLAHHSRREHVLVGLSVTAAAASTAAASASAAAAAAAAVAPSSSPVVMATTVAKATASSAGAGGNALVLDAHLHVWPTPGEYPYVAGKEPPASLAENSTAEALLAGEGGRVPFTRALLSFELREGA